MCAENILEHRSYANRLRDDDLCEDFSSAFISHVQHIFRESFVLLRGMARSLSSIIIQHTCKRIRRTALGMHDTKMKRRRI